MEKEQKIGTISKLLSKKNLIVIIIAFFLIITLANSIVIVRSGFTGVVITLGAVEEIVLTEGMHFKIPFFQNVQQIDNRTKKIEVDASAASKDLQIVTCKVAVNYKVNNASSATLFRNVGMGYSDIVIAPAIQESIKAATAQFTAEQLITQRQIVSDKIKETLTNKIGQYGITVEVFNIVNFDFSEEFNNAVEAKQTAEQNALKAQQDLVRIQVEAEQTIVQAEAEAKAIELINETLAKNPEYIEYIKWNKWDGVLPVYIGGDGSAILDLSNLD